MRRVLRHAALSPRTKAGGAGARYRALFLARLVPGQHHAHAFGLSLSLGAVVLQMADFAAALEREMGHQRKAAVQGRLIGLVCQAQAGQRLAQGLGGTRRGRTARILHLRQQLLHGGHAEELGQIVVLPALGGRFFPGGVHGLFDAFGQPDHKIGNLAGAHFRHAQFLHPLTPERHQTFQHGAAQPGFLTEGHEAFHIEIRRDPVFLDDGLAHDDSLR